MKIVLCAAAMAVAIPAAAQVLDATDANRLLSLVQAENASAALSTDSVGDPKITADLGGVTYSLFFYGCSDGRYCRSVQFQVGLDMAEGLAPDTANQWNRERRFASAFLDDDSDPFLQMDVILEYGMSEANFTEALRLWEGSLTDFMEFVDW